MNWLVPKSWFLLLYLDMIMRFRGLNSTYRFVREQKVYEVSTSGRYEAEKVCHAVDLACVFYFKRVFCLQRSAVTTLLLRRHGWPAEMVIGVQMLPFKSHAWVEVEARIVNDKPYMPDIYRILDRC